MSDEQDVQAELAKLIYALAKIRDVLKCKPERYITLEWYQAALIHITKYVDEALPGEDCKEG